MCQTSVFSLLKYPYARGVRRTNFPEAWLRVDLAESPFLLEASRTKSSTRAMDKGHAPRPGNVQRAEWRHKCGQVLAEHLREDERLGLTYSSSKPAAAPVTIMTLPATRPILSLCLLDLSIQIRMSNSCASSSH
jgi:hypothetical protein